MAVIRPGGEDGGHTTRFEPIIRRSSPQERAIVWELTAVGPLGLAIRLAIMISGQYRRVLACFAAAALCLLMGYLTLRPQAVLDQGGAHSRTLLRSYNIAWPGSREAFGIIRQLRSVLCVREMGPNVRTAVRGEAGTMVLGGMSIQAFTEPRARYLMEEELDRLWAWAASWGLVPAEDPEGTGIHGREGNDLSHP